MLITKLFVPAWVKARRKPNTPSPEFTSPIPVSQAERTKITVLCYMGFEFEKIINDLFKCGMKFLEDYYFVDAGAYEQFVVANDIKQRVDWLKGRYVDGYIYVWWTDDNQG